MGSASSRIPPNDLIFIVPGSGFAEEVVLLIFIQHISNGSQLSVITFKIAGVCSKTIGSFSCWRGFMFCSFQELYFSLLALPSRQAISFNISNTLG